MLDQMTMEIQARIAEVERRHSDALLELQIKLERLSGDAERARPAMPPALATAFSRIEAGMAELVDRIAETVPERRRGAEAFVFGVPKSEHSHFVFNPPARAPVAPVAFDGVPTGEHWDPDQVDALARLYESGEAALAKHLPEAALFAPGQWACEAEKTAAPMAAAAPAATDQHALPMASNRLGDNRDWAEQRFAAIADHISETVRNARPDGALDTLMARVDQFEIRFTNALDGMATKSDIAKLRPDALQKVEAQLQELAGHVESAHQQLTRLDGIEQHLADLTAFAQASMEASDTAPDVLASAGPTEHDLARLAELAVERALARAPHVATNGDPAQAQARADEMQALLAQVTADRRLGDQQTTGMLETIQEALIRLIDRIDVIDAGIGGMPAKGGHTHAMPDVVHVAAIVPHSDAGAPMLQPTEAAAEPVAANVDAKPLRTIRRRERRVMEPAAETSVNEVAPETVSDIPAKRPTINIKDLRIKMDRPAAAGANTGTGAMAADAAAPAVGRVPRLRAGKPQADAGGSGKRGIMVAAAALAVVGASYFASLLLSDRYSSQIPAATATVVPPASGVPQMGAAAQSPTAPKPAQQATGAASPPGMVGLPARANPTTPPAPPMAIPGAQPALPIAPAAAPVAPAPNVTAKPATAQQQPAAPNLEFTPTKPVSVPETATDDLSQADINMQDDTIEQKKTALAEARPSPATAPLQLMQGMAVVPASEQMQAREVAAAQRQASMALASERMGFQARPAEMFSQRFGAATPAQVVPQPKPAARPPSGPSPIVTGSTPAAPLQPISLNQAPAEAAAELVPANSEMPPALVGPLSLRIAAQKGDPSATFEVATRFAEGRGPKQDYNQAMIWYQRSAAKGFAAAQYRLGTLYERGLATTADPARAKLWYKRSAEQGNVKAMHNLAVLSAGNGQAAPDYATAAKWFGQASEYGLPDSQFNFGVLYENGLGVAKDPSAAYVWYSLAARNGDQEATRRRDRLLGTLDVAILKDADDRVRNWHGRASDSKVNDARVAGDLWRNRTAQADDAPANPTAAPAILRGQPLPN